MFCSYLLNHHSASEEWRHSLQKILFRIENADTGGSVDFMTGEREEIAINILHIDRFVRDELCGIQQCECAVLARKAHDLAKGGDRPEDIAYGGDRYKFYLTLLENILCILHPQCSIILDPNPFHFDSYLFLQLEPWNDIADGGCK